MHPAKELCPVFWQALWKTGLWQTILNIDFHGKHTGGGEQDSN